MAKTFYTGGKSDDPKAEAETAEGLTALLFMGIMASGTNGTAVGNSVAEVAAEVDAAPSGRLILRVTVEAVDETDLLQ